MPHDRWSASTAPGPCQPSAVPAALTSVLLSAGFLGRHLVQQLLDSGRYDVVVFDIRDAGISGVRTVVGDLRDQAQVEAAVSGRAHCTALPVNTTPDSSAFSQSDRTTWISEGFTTIRAEIHHCKMMLVSNAQT